MLTVVQERAKRSYKGQDCVSVRLNGQHVAYACCTHRDIIMADIAQGDDTMWIDCWTIPSFLIDANNKVKCDYKDD